MIRHFIAAMMAVICAGLVSVPAGARVLESNKYGNWTYEYFSGSRVTACVASRYYSNAQFSVRLYGDRMDVVFYRDDFRFRWDARLGTAVVRVRGRNYRLSAETPARGGSAAPRASVLYLSVPSGRYRAFFNDLKRARALDIALWNNKSYPVDLTGSSRALDAALRCWDRRRTGS